jgi:hypothetical protein
MDTLELLGSDFVFQIGNGESPEVFANACSVADVSGVGESKPLVDISAYCDNARRYRGGLADGNEVTMVLNLTENAQDISDLFASYDTGDNITIRCVRKGEGGSVSDPEDSPAGMYLEWAMALISWGLGLPIGDKSALTFTGKISGGVTRVGFGA